MTQLHDNIVGLDAAILMHPRTWEASGHVENFTDPLVDCKKCKSRFRADHLPPENLEKKVCPDCGGELTDTRKFNLTDAPGALLNSLLLFDNKLYISDLANSKIYVREIIEFDNFLPIIKGE